MTITLHTRVSLTTGQLFILPHSEYKKIVRQINTNLAKPRIYQTENLFGDKVAFNIGQVTAVEEVSATGLKAAGKYYEELEEIFGDEQRPWE